VYSTERNSVWVASVMDSHAHPDRRPNQGFPSDTEGRANAHLLAAAPDLLEAASAYEEYMNSPEPTLQKDHEPLHTALLAAIALAEGK